LSLARELARLRERRQPRMPLQALADLDARTPDIYRQWPPQRLELAAMGIRVLVVFDRNADASEAPLETSIDKEQVLVLTCDAGDSSSFCARS